MINLVLILNNNSQAPSTQIAYQLASCFLQYNKNLFIFCYQDGADNYNNKLWQDLAQKHDLNILICDKSLYKITNTQTINLPNNFRLSRLSELTEVISQPETKTLCF